MDDRAQRFHVASRMASIAPFEVMEIQTLARRLEAQGRDVSHLEIGEPDFTTPGPVVEAAKRDFVAQCGLPEEAFYADSFTSEADKHASA